MKTKSFRKRGTVRKSNLLHCFSCLVAIMLLSSGITCMAQAPADTTDNEENVIGGRVQRTNTQKESNVLGTPVYYNLDGSVKEGNHRGNPRGEYNMPEHHYRNTLSRHFNTYFCELEGMFGPKDIAGGFNFTYLPERWGMYGSMMVGLRRNYASVGAALRLSDTYDEFDWHLYGGVICGDGVGGEGGIRIGGTRSDSGFGWCTGSMGVAVMDGRGYLTLGLSLEIAALTTLALLLF